MQIMIGSIVRSQAGRDAGRLFVVVGMDSLFANIADGRLRRAEKPKRKKLKHLVWVADNDPALTQRLRTEGKATNSEIRKLIALRDPDSGYADPAVERCKNRVQEVE